MKKEVLDLLAKLKIDYEYLDHAPAETMEDLKHIEKMIGGNYCKNLFLRNANGKVHYLVVVSGDKRVDLKSLAKEIGSSRLSFGSEERLYKNLKLKKGQVGPFGLMNDKESKVICVLDKDLIDEEKLSFHPNDNAATVVISYESLKRYLDYIEAKIAFAVI